MPTNQSPDAGELSIDLLLGSYWLIVCISGVFCCSVRVRATTPRGMLWPVLGEQEGSTPAPSQGASECQLSSFTGEGEMWRRMEKGGRGGGEERLGEGGLRVMDGDVVVSLDVCKGETFMHVQFCNCDLTFK